MRMFLVIAFATLPLMILSAQNNWCGSDLIQLSEKELAKADAIFERVKSPKPKSNTIDSVAVTVHIVESRAQPGAVDFTIEDVEREIGRVNEVFAGAGIHFFICGTPRYLEDAGSYNFTTGDALNEFYYVPNTINIYFVNDLYSDSGQGLCGYAQFPFLFSPEDRYIMMNKFCSTDGGTLTHELGHFYGLYHTHETQFGRELVDGSNCSSAGDRLCDTSADPNLGNPNYMSGCTYVGLATDQNGAKYAPPVSNYMSYAPASCQFFFSEQQERLIQEVHQNENAYLARNCDFYPDFAIEPEQVFFEIRSDEKINVSYNLSQIDLGRGYNVTLKISLADKPEDTGLLIHEERLILEAGNPNSLLSYNLDFPIIKGSGIYYLKAYIDADNQVIERTERNNFALSTIEVDNSSLGDISIFPNPTSGDLKLFLRDSEALRALKMRVYRYDGRLVWEDKDYKIREEFFRILDLNHLPTGLYLLSLYFEDTEQVYTLKFFKK